MLYKSKFLDQEIKISRIMAKSRVGMILPSGISPSVTKSYLYEKVSTCLPSRFEGCQEHELPK